METTIYINRRGIIDACGFETVETGDVALHNLAKQGRLLEPDVYVGRRYGWLPERVSLYAAYRAAGHLEDTGPRPEWWHNGHPLYRLSLAEVAVKLGLTKIAVMKRVERSRFATAACAITRNGRAEPRSVFGWEEEALETYGKHFGYVDQTGEVADIRRGGARRKVFTEGPVQAAA